MPGPFRRLADRLRERRERRRGPDLEPVPAPGPPPFAPGVVPADPSRPASAPGVGVLPLLWLAWKHRRMLKMTLSKLTVILGAVGLLGGSLYQALVVKDLVAAGSLFSAALAAFGIGNQTAITRDIVDPTRPNPTP